MGVGLIISLALGLQSWLPQIVRSAFYSSSWVLAPSGEECIRMLQELIAARGRRTARALLGVPGLTLQGWLAGKSSAPARRLIWLTWVLVLHPELVQSEHDLATWGRFRAISGAHPLHPSGS